jgi:hypothetical protein
MSRFFPRAEHVKDQKYARSVLNIQRVDLGIKLGVFGSLVWPFLPGVANFVTVFE